MATVYTRNDPADRAKLVAALQLLTEHYAEAGVDGPDVAAAKMTVASTVTSYAMASLVRRLVAEGYVRDQRAVELRERADNLQSGRGFVLSNEREPLNSPPKEAPKRAPKAKPLDPEDQQIVDDLFK